jgi:hypothetical protein
LTRTFFVLPQASGTAGQENPTSTFGTSQLKISWINELTGHSFRRVPQSGARSLDSRHVIEDLLELERGTGGLQSQEPGGIEGLPDKGGQDAFEGSR